MTKTKTLRVEDKTHDRLSKHFERYGETMDDLINKILDRYEGVTKK